MKLLFVFCLLPFVATAQQDFDYAIYTRHSDLLQLSNSSDSNKIALLLERRIVKESNKLIVIPLSNTGEALEYKIRFSGVQFRGVPTGSHNIFEGTKGMSFEYITDDQKYRFSIWPTIPLVEIEEPKTGKLIDRYY